MKESSPRNWKEQATQKLLGQIILTRYNNRTYRIDGIDWKKSPKSTFLKRSGEEVSYDQYYAMSYNKTLQEHDQPLLIHTHRTKGKADEIVHLVPELCSMTGM